MPSNWWAIDTNFPSFTGEETPKQQIQALHDYLYQFRQSLQYSLQNLSAANFNETALKNMTDAQKNEVAQLLTNVTGELTRISASMGSLANRVGTVEKEIAALKEQDTDLEAIEEWTAAAEGQLKELADKDTEIEEKVSDLQETVSGEGGLQETVQQQGQELQKISGAVQAAEDGSVTVGAEGKDLHLVGNIYINGVLYEQGGTT